MRGLGTSVTPIAAGVRTDCERLLGLFIEVSSVRFEHFAKCFKDMKFSLIFRGRTSEPEYREFAQKALQLALTYCFPPYSFQVRIGGLYLLYSLYNLQHEKYRMLIRITIEQWSDLLLFLTEIAKQQHFDACSVLHSLIRSHAFQFCAFADEFNPLYFKKYENKEDTDKGTDINKSETLLVQELKQDALYGQMRTLHDQYMNIKNSICEGDLNTTDDLGFVVNDPTVFVDEVLKDLESKANKKTKTARRPGAVEQHDDEDDDSSEAGSRRIALKHFAYSQATQQSRHRRHRQQVEGAQDASKKAQRKYPSPTKGKRAKQTANLAEVKLEQGEAAERPSEQPATSLSQQKAKMRTLRAATESRVKSHTAKRRATVALDADAGEKMRKPTVTSRRSVGRPSMQLTKSLANNLTDAEAMDSFGEEIRTQLAELDSVEASMLSALRKTGTKLNECKGMKPGKTKAANKSKDKKRSKPNDYPILPL